MRRPHFALMLAAGMLVGPAGGAQSQLTSLSGDYMAGLLASQGLDDKRATASFNQALTLSAESQELLEQAMNAEVRQGRLDLAVPLAERLLAVDPDHRIGHLIVGVANFKKGNFEDADAALKAASSGPIGELTGELTRAWNAAAQGDSAAAQAILTFDAKEDWKKFYLSYHKALLADVTGRTQDARAAFQEIKDHSVRTTLAYARHATKAGDVELAAEILDAQLAKSDHVLVRELRDSLGSGPRAELLVASPTQGMAEVFYGLGEALTSEGGVSMGIIYLQLALHVEPQNIFALAALANAQESRKLYADAIATYEKVPPGTALQPAIEIRKALNLNSLEKVDEAKAVLERQIKERPADLTPLDTLGNILRARKRYSEAIEAYSAALKLVPTPTKKNWSLFYSRGTCYERLGNWEPAERDLRKALELYPDQPLALNYLGYSMVDSDRNVKEGVALIEKAVALKPDDGFIVDSLGWAHYKLGGYEEALRYLERAVILKSDDELLAEHLGDALWKLGHKLQAQQLWAHAATLSTSAEAKAKFSAKVANGLPK